MMADRNLVILYGSQTGTAADVAKRIRKQARLRRFDTTLMALNEFKIDQLIATPLIVFVCSTTGQGEEPDNMKIFWRAMLRRRLPLNSLVNLQFAVLGLGDSSYQQFNFTAKRLHRRLLKLGAVAFHEMGLADDQHELGFDGLSEPWIQKLMEKLMEKFPLAEGEDVLADEGLPVASYAVTVLTGTAGDFAGGSAGGSAGATGRTAGGSAEGSAGATGDFTGGTAGDSARGSAGGFVGGSARGSVGGSAGTVNGAVESAVVADPPFLARLILNERATSEDHFQDVRFMRFDIADSNLTHEPGDVVVVCPQNLPTFVEEILSFLNLNGEEIIQLSINDEDVKLPDARILTTPCSVREAATKLWDFRGVPRRSFFELLVFFAVDEREKQRLQEFASPTGTDDLYGYCFRPKRTAFEVLQDFSDTAKRIPLEYLFDLFPPIKSRQFSIASSHKHHKDEVHLLVAVVTYQTKLKRPRTGLCSHWLASLSVNSFVPIWVKKGTLKFNKVEEKPVVMVGPGTGVAPFRAFIFDRFSSEIANSVLFFGCRDRKKDFYFEKEWLKLQEEGFLTLFLAFSREQTEKVYVQDVMKKASLFLVDAIVSQEGFFYLAGNSKNMPVDVRFALKRILSEQGEMGMEEAEEYIVKMVSDGRYQTETWG